MSVEVPYYEKFHLHIPIHTCEHSIVLLTNVLIFFDYIVGRASI